MALTTRTVTFELYKPNGQPETRRVKAELIPGGYDSSGMVPRAVVYGTPNAAGAGSLTLWANEGGVEPTRYLITLPSRETFYINVPTSPGPFTLDALRELGGDPTEPNFPTLTGLLGETLVSKYGATGDADDDATDAIEEALNVGAGIIRFGPGWFNVTRQLDWTSARILRGAGMGATRIESDISNGDHMFRFRDVLTDPVNKYVAWSGMHDVWINGRLDNLGWLIKVENPYHFTGHRIRSTRNLGGIFDVEKGAGGSTYGQNFFLNEIFFQHARRGGVRIYTAGAGQSVDIARIGTGSINQCGYYGIYGDRVTDFAIEHLEMAGYYYGSMGDQNVGSEQADDDLSAHQAYPIVLNGGSTVSVRGAMSFENNGGNPAGAGTPSYNIVTGMNGDTQADAANTVQQLTLDGPNFKPSTTGPLHHVRVRFVQDLDIPAAHFEGAVGIEHYGLNFNASSLTEGGYFIGAGVRWGATLTGKFTGSARPVLMMDVPFGTIGNGRKAYGSYTEDLTKAMAWSRFTGEAHDRFQILGDGKAMRGSGSAAPINIGELPVILTANLPAAAAAMSGLACIEDAGAGTYNLITYHGTTRRRTALGAAF